MNVTLFPCCQLCLREDNLTPCSTCDGPVYCSDFCFKTDINHPGKKRDHEASATYNNIQTIAQKALQSANITSEGVLQIELSASTKKKTFLIKKIRVISPKPDENQKAFFLLNTAAILNRSADSLVVHISVTVIDQKKVPFDEVQNATYIYLKHVTD
ncbi:MAG: hypothetical protein S4CHLAM45_14670 [Chlamydiales bacterium]|nr:hypothetical protein [Chlamydiales bacterium]MCH9620571.1 hypothetical protein [Chlamydiales bacterium]MCH9623557.1 hypothetical protein [Chlamydiales bacterium]